ncbi:hypothetical protein IQ218_06620 [Synechocystis salina LEGE 06099]|uniref:hypothetical protein n=1 Tax=Synechocystis salina TaxID=945780 RepID=UPI00187EA592|nr:hypothetical protein [Synechocystis salina]MBE9203181.1 hypothetical protein [Synechocystis salina LEGE 06099]
MSISDGKEGTSKTINFFNLFEIKTSKNKIIIQAPDKNNKKTEENTQENSVSPKNNNYVPSNLDNKIDIENPEVVLKSKILILLVYSNSNLDIFKKAIIPLSDFMCEKLYELTQYLCIEESLLFNSKANQIQNFRVSKGEELDDDIYLIKLDLRDDDHRFRPKVNQVDRIRAFRELPNLVDDIRVSHRLRIEAGQLFNLYHR